MPAVTADTLTLPRIEVPVAGADGGAPRPRPVRSVTTAPSDHEGLGFPVRRAFAGVSRADIDPFVMMDQMGEVDWKPYEPRGTDWHPHRGFETVTYIIDGTFQHQDSHGGGGTITDGGTQWMTAGRGILHIETPPEKLVISGGTFHGVQLWVNLPRRSKMAKPRYQNLEARKVTLLSSPDGGALVRLIAGDLGGHRGPGSTHTPIVLSHITVSPGARSRRAVGAVVQRARLRAGRLRCGRRRAPPGEDRSAHRVRLRRHRHPHRHRRRAPRRAAPRW